MLLAAEEEPVSMVVGALTSFAWWTAVGSSASFTEMSPAAQKASLAAEMARVAAEKARRASPRRARIAAQRASLAAEMARVAAEKAKRLPVEIFERRLAAAKETAEGLIIGL